MLAGGFIPPLAIAGKITFTAGDAVERGGRATAPYSPRLAGGNVGKGIRVSGNWGADVSLAV